MNIKRFFNAFFSAFSSYDAANYSSNRGFDYSQNPTDAKKELDNPSRLEIVRRARKLEKNSGHIRGALRDIKVYAVGKGIEPNPQTANDGWNKAAKNYFYGWSLRPEITGRFSFRECQNMVIQMLEVDGECFVIKCFDEKGEPKIQLIECHRVKKIEYDKFGRPTAYIFKLGDDMHEESRSASSVLHIFDPKRPSQSRACSEMQHSISDIQDIREILGLEKIKVKAISDIVHVIEKENGLSDSGDFNPVKSAVADSSITPAQMNKILGGKNITLGIGEKMNVHESNIPSPTFSGFLSTLERNSSMGIIPSDFSFDSSKIGGAAIRLVTSKTQRYVDDRGLTLDERFNAPVWFFVIGCYINRGLLSPIKDWWYCTWTHPKRLTVDAGREEQQNRENIKLGLKSLTEDFAERGLEFEESLNQRITDIRKIMRACGQPDSTPIPMWLLYNPNNSQIIFNQDTGSKNNE